MSLEADLLAASVREAACGREKNVQEPPPTFLHLRGLSSRCMALTEAGTIWLQSVWLNLRSSKPADVTVACHRHDCEVAFILCILPSRVEVEIRANAI